MSKKSTKGVKASKLAPKGKATKAPAAPESKGVGRQGQLRDVGNVKLFQKKLEPLSTFTKRFKLVRLTNASVDRPCTAGARAGLKINRRTMIESVLATATPKKPLRLAEVRAIVEPFGVAAVGGAHIAELLTKRLIATDGAGNYYATKNKPGRN